VKQDDQPAVLQVEARVDAEGPPQPLAFVWDGDHLRVTSIGRTWRDSGEHHYLVMVPGDLVFELAYSFAEGTWRLVRRPQDFGPSRTSV
jgi:hypothetical protein